MKIGIVGHLGVVGSAIAHGFTRIGHTVLGFDTKDETTQLSSLLEAELIFICVPTPQRDDGSCDTRFVEEVVDGLFRRQYLGLVVIKSTVPPGTTDRLAKQYRTIQGVTHEFRWNRLAFCPEFLRERAAAVDFVENHDLLVIGVEHDQFGHPTQHASLDMNLIAQAHGHLPKKIAIMSRTEAELAKYYSNVFNALRVVFANEFYEVCKKIGADYQIIKQAMVQRSTIQDVYLDCNERYRGFGGMCLPKDTAAFAELVRRIAPDMKLFETIVDENNKFATTVPEGMRP